MKVQLTGNLDVTFIHLKVDLQKKYLSSQQQLFPMDSTITHLDNCS